jgi:phage terminase large subunit-like protein
MRILAGLFIFGEKQIIGMAQTRQLALDTFKEVADRAMGVDFLAKRIKRVVRTNGQEELEIYCEHGVKCSVPKCQRIRKYSVRAATSEGARGVSADLLYIDELREITEAAWSAATPTVSARPNPQIYTSSNAGDSTSIVLNDLRARALVTKSPTLGWWEWSAHDQLRIDDRLGWQQANPSMGYLPLSEERLESYLESLSPDTFKTEHLCQWVTALESAWNMDKWVESAAPIAMVEGLPTYMALDLTFNRDKAFLVSVQEADSKYKVFLHEWHKDGGLDAVEIASEIALLTRKYYPRILAYDPKTAGYIAPYLGKLGVAVSPTPWESTAFAIMCDQTLQAMNTGRLQHPGQDTLTEHLISCSRTNAGDGGWRIRRRAATNPISAAVALVMAVGHASSPAATPVIMSV